MEPVNHDLYKVRLALEDFVRGVEVHRAKIWRRSLFGHF
jgi:hypothetical protein